MTLYLYADHCICQKKYTVVDAKVKFLEILNKILYLLYPDKCICCDKIIQPGEPCCIDCYEKIDDKGRIKIIDISEDTQVQCIAFTEYSDAFREAILKFKFGGRRYYYKYFALLLNYIINTFPELEHFDYISFIPTKNSKRKYNQTELLAKELSKNTKIPCLPLLRKIKDTLCQHDLNAYDRAFNVLGAYQINDNYAAEVCGSKIILCDDVMTTGNTLRECSKTLLNGGAKRVVCLTLSWA